MNLIEKYKAWRNAENPAPVTLERILGVLQAYFRKWFKEGIPQHIQEQYNKRLKDANPECIEKGVCVNCGCAVPDKFWEDAGCYYNGYTCYPSMKTKKEWNIFKKIDKIK